MVESIGKRYKPWLIASLVILVGSLLSLGVVVTGMFVYFSGLDKPLWLELLFVVAALGVAVGFAGFFVMMLLAGWKSFREGRRVQVLPPEGRQG